MDPVTDLINPDIYQYGLYSEESVEQTCHMLRYCMKKHPTLGKYVNSIVFRSSDHTNRTMRDSYSQSSALINMSEVMNDFLIGKNPDMTIVNRYAKIRFDNFNLRTLIDRFISRSYSRNDDDRFHKIIYRLDMDGQYTTTALNENIDPDFKRLPGYFLNASSCHMLLNSANNSDRNKNKINYVAEFILYGDKDTLVGYVSTDCHLVIRWQVIRYMIDNFGYYVVRQVLEKILLRFSEVYDFLLGKNPKHMRKMLNFAVDNLWEGENESQIMKKIRNHIDSSIYSDQIDVSFFQPILKDVANSAKRMIENAKKDALMAGMAVSSKMSLLGWEISSFGKNINNLVWWEKSVEIVPKIFIRDGCQYIVPDNYKDHPYKVTKLYVSSASILYCEGSHPNVSGGKVCMGNLKPINFVEADFEKIKEFLQQATSLLEIMNYDSPHESKYREQFLKVAKKSEIGEKGSEEVPRASIGDVGIRQIIIQQPIEEPVTGEAEAQVEETQQPVVEVQQVPENVNPDELEVFDHGRILNTIQRVPFGVHENNIEFMRMIRDYCQTPNHDIHECAINRTVWVCRNLHNNIVIGQCENEWDDTAYFIYRDRNYLPFTISREIASEILNFIIFKDVSVDIECPRPKRYINSIIKEQLYKLDNGLPFPEFAVAVNGTGEIDDLDFDDEDEEF